MKLTKGTIRPGTVLEVLENGEIKVTAPGLFSIIDDTSTLPPIMPWFIGNNSNSFSKLIPNDEVWILNFTDNPRQLYWFRKDNLGVNNELTIPYSDKRVVDECNVEIICNRDADGEWATIYFSDGSGWVIGKGESIIQIAPDGSILLNTGLPNRCIDINGKNISIGSKGKSAHPAACGDATQKALHNMCVLLNKVAMKCATNPYTIPVATAILKDLHHVTKFIPDIPSDNVTID